MRAIKTCRIHKEQSGGAVAHNHLLAVCCKPKDWEHPFKHEVYMSEYNTGKSLWASKPITMLKKVAMAQAFRLAFPDELGGMPYTSDELGTDEQAERNVTPQKPQQSEKVDEPKQVEAPKPEEKKPPVEGMTTANKIAPHCTP